VCCSVSQCVAVCHSVSQCVAVCHSVSQCVADLLHCIALCRRISVSSYLYIYIYAPLSLYIYMNPYSHISFSQIQIQRVAGQHTHTTTHAATHTVTHTLANTATHALRHTLSQLQIQRVAGQLQLSQLPIISAGQNMSVVVQGLQNMLRKVCLHSSNESRTHRLTCTRIYLRHQLVDGVGNMLLILCWHTRDTRVHISVL